MVGEAGDRIEVTGAILESCPWHCGVTWPSTGGLFACGLLFCVVIRLLGLAMIRLIDWAWWGSSGRGGVAGAAWHLKEVLRRPSLLLAWFGSHHHETDRAPKAVAVTLLLGCALMCLALGVLDFLDVVDAD